MLGPLIVVPLLSKDKGIALLILDNSASKQEGFSPLYIDLTIEDIFTEDFGEASSMAKISVADLLKKNAPSCREEECGDAGGSPVAKRKRLRPIMVEDENELVVEATKEGPSIGQLARPSWPQTLLP